MASRNSDYASCIALVCITALVCALEVVGVSVAVFRAGCVLTLNSDPLVAKCRNLSALFCNILVAICIELVDVASIALSGAGSFNSVFGHGISRNIRNLLAAISYAANAALNGIGFAVVRLAIFVNAGQLAISNDSHLCSMCAVQCFIFCTMEDVIAVGADIIASIASAINNVTVFVLIYVNDSAGIFFSNSCSMECLNSGLQDSAILKLSFLGNCNKSILVSMIYISCSEHQSNFSNASKVFLRSLEVVAINQLGRHLCTVNEYRLTAVLADSIAPAIILAGRCLNDLKGVVVVAKCGLHLYGILTIRLTAIAAVSNGNAGKLTACCYDFLSYGVLANLASVSVLCELNYFNIISFAVIAEHDFDAGLLCSCIFLDADNNAISMAAISRCCQSSSRNQSCDHENSHQHAQQSLFHFLLFTSV